MKSIIPYASNGSFMDEIFNDLWSFPKLYHDEVPVRAKTDVKEFDDRYVVDVEAPGVKEEDIGIEFHDGHLTIKGQRAKKNDEVSGNYKVSEIYNGYFSRTFRLPNVDDEKIEAWLENGMLKILVPKLESKKKKKIFLKKINE